MKRFYQFAFGIITAFIFTLSSGCTANDRYGANSGADSVYMTPIRWQPIPVVVKGSFHRRPGYTLVELVPVQPNPSDSRVRPYSKDQVRMDRDKPPELDYGGGAGAGGAGAGGGGAGGGGAGAGGGGGG